VLTKEQMKSHVNQYFANGFGSVQEKLRQAKQRESKQRESPKTRDG